MQTDSIASVIIYIHISITSYKDFFFFVLFIATGYNFLKILFLNLFYIHRRKWENSMLCKIPTYQHLYKKVCSLKTIDIYYCIMITVRENYIIKRKDILYQDLPG